MVLEHVPHDSRLFVILASVLDPDAFRSGDLHIVDMLAVADRLEDGIGKPEHQEVLNRLLPQIVIDAVDLMLGEGATNACIQGDCARQALAEGFLDDDPDPGSLLRVHHSRGDTRFRQQVDCAGIDLGGMAR